MPISLNQRLRAALLPASLCALLNAAVLTAAPRPNFLWLTSEDHGPHMGCYGDSFASTPNVDKLAARGMIYTHAWSCAPVCAPARTTLISGLYAPSTGAEHMRSLVPYPAGKQMFTQVNRSVVRQLMPYLARFVDGKDFGTINEENAK